MSNHRENVPRKSADPPEAEGVPIPVPVLIGPTASGKTALAFRLRQQVPGVEIVSADSRQIYVGMDIGTAKPTVEERRETPHHLVDILTPDNAYSAGKFARDAEAIITAVRSRGGIPLVVGGTGFYVRALFEGLNAPATDPAIYAELERRLLEEGYEQLLQELQRVDPEGWENHPAENRVKTLRALACYHQTGIPYSQFRSPDRAANSRYRPRFFCLMPDRAELYAQINRRVVQMVEQGLVEETGRLLDAGYGPDSPGLRTVGYVEALEFISGKIGMDAMIAAIQQATRRYAKRQITWFRNQVPQQQLLELDRFVELLEGESG